MALEYCQSILAELGLFDWSIQWIGGARGECHEDLKLICLGIGNSNPQALFLHELAHIGTKDHNGWTYDEIFHGPAFRIRLRKLWGMFGEGVAPLEMDQLIFSK